MLSVVACDDTTTAPPPLVLTPSGGCGEAMFFALDDAFTTSLSIQVTTWDRPQDQVTELSFVLPDPAAFVRLTRGVMLDETVCNDVYPEDLVASKVDAVAGTVRLRLEPQRSLDPPAGCGATGTAEVVGLRYSDGTRVADLTITTTAIGCSIG